MDWIRKENIGRPSDLHSAYGRQYNSNIIRCKVKLRTKNKALQHNKF